MTAVKAIIFDLGGVLIDWNPRYVYRQLFKTDEEVEWFLANITTLDWNDQQDAGYPIEKATKELIEKYPEWEFYIRAYYERWKDMLADPIRGTVKILEQLKDHGDYKLYALTNWSAELFPYAIENFEFLKWFDGIVVSGEEKMRKPQPEFYQVLLNRYNQEAASTLFIDDNTRNIKAAKEMGLQTIHFSSPEALLNDLKHLKLI